jgi:hypothetical protein
VPAAKREEQAEARRLRRDQGMPMKQIAATLGVSPASVHLWTRDIVLTAEHRARNLRIAAAKRAARWAEHNRQRRREYQLEGRAQARAGDAFHEAGCMLYWAEGAKTRGDLRFCNSDRAMVAFFWRFLKTYYAVDLARITVALNVYLNNGLLLAEIEDWWNEGLGLPRRAFRSHTTDNYPTSSSGQRPKRLPYGVCTLRYSSTEIVQQIYGAIQEYGGFDEPRWLDGPPRRPQRLD